MESVFFIHIGSAIVGQSIVFFASLVSVFFISRQESIKYKQIKFSKISLEFLAKLIHVFLKTGFVFLSLSLITGFYIYFISAQNNKLELKIIWSLIVWAWYFIILLLYNFSFCSRKRLAEMTVVGCFILLGSLFGVVFK